MPSKLTSTFAISAIFFCTFSSSSEYFDDSVFEELDYGLYWAGADNEFEKAGVNTQSGSTYYDPSKPTLIYIHGWSSDSSQDMYRETFYSDANDRPEIDFAEMWASYGYNIGVMYWNQFADEAEVKDAESKIWSTEGEQNMRWLDSNGEYHYGDVNEPIAELLLDNYIEAMANYEGNDIRIAGHSLGSQVAIRLTRLLQESNEAGKVADNLLPGRLTLLDSYFSNWSKEYLDWAWTGEAARTLVSEMISDYDIAIDSYRSSVVTSSIFVGDENNSLHNMLAFCEQDTSFFTQFEQSQKHSAATWLYLWSIDYVDPTVEDSDYLGVSAAADNDLVRTWMSANKHITQQQGGDTKTPADNTYITTSRL